MEKLTRENIYINLQGKSKEERLEILNYLLSINEKCESGIYARMKLSKTLEFYENKWFPDYGAGNKQEVTIQQLKEILQPMENKEYLLITEDGHKAKEGEIVSWVISDKYKYELSLCKKHKTLIENSEGVYKVFIEKGKALEYHDKMLLSRSEHNNTTLTEQLEKAEAEVKRLKEAIEDSKIKVGDWVKRVVRKDCRVFKINDTHNLEHYNNKIYSKIYSKIQDQELTNKLNELIK